MRNGISREHPTYHGCMTKDPVKQLLKDGPKFLRILTYAEVFGGPRPSLSDFRARLASLPKMPLVGICAVLNAFVRSDASSDELLNFATHKAMIRAYFPAPIANAILAVASGDSPRVAFHRQQLLFVAKEALMYASDTSDLPMSNQALGELFLIANDHMHTEEDDGIQGTLTSFAKLATTLLPVQEAANGNVRHKIMRSYQMIKLAPAFSETKPYFDLAALFKQATGLELSEYFAFIVSAITRFHHFDPAKFMSDPSSYSLDEQWFASTKVTPESIQAFFSLVAATPEAYQHSLQTSRGPNDFTAFRDKPLLRDGAKLDLMDLWMLAEKFEAGPFWLVHSQLSKKEKSLFHSFWGKLFERYIADVFIAAANPEVNVVQSSPLFSGTNEELSDTIVVCGRSAVLVEAKSAMFTARAKYEGDYKLLMDELESKLVESGDREQAVKQLARNIERAFGPNAQSIDTVDLKYVTTVFPVIITRDDLGSIAGVNSYLGERFESILNRKQLRVSVAPLICLSSEHAEALSAYLSDTRITDILEAHIRANRAKSARYLTMPFFATANSVLKKRGGRPIPNQIDNFDQLIQECVAELGLETLNPEGTPNSAQ
jgi:hypothetical protein